MDQTGQEQEQRLSEMTDRLLGQMLTVLTEMKKLAQRSTEPDCTPRERLLLQRDLELYRKRLDRLADSLHELLPVVDLDNLL